MGGRTVDVLAVRESTARLTSCAPAVGLAVKYVCCRVKQFVFEGVWSMCTEALVQND